MNDLADRFRLSSISVEEKQYVERIMLDVRRRGDKALLDYTSRPKPFDNVRLAKSQLMVSGKELKESEERVAVEVKKAILFLMKNVKKVVKLQMKAFRPIAFREKGFEYSLRLSPLERIGVLVPGGRASYVSTLVMAAYPAVLVGVREVHILTPPRPDGSVNPAILYAARLMGLTRVYRCNMVAGVGALAFGTKSIPRVDKIFGPGNKFVMIAKMVASSYGVSIDIPAGPSELVVLADSSADPRLIALDLAAQAEHSPASFTALITDSRRVAKSVEKIFKILSERHHLKARLNLYLVGSIQEGVGKCNLLAPEHVSLHVKNPRAIAGKLTVAGTVFLGGCSPPAIGDYASGSNHILPTSGHAKARGGVTVLDYLRLVSYQGFSMKYVKSVSRHVEALSNVEGLPLHGVSVKARLTRRLAV
ncbi:MAG: histidinol dehydrogenase [Candidatus Brockarchaeota archaeon]|nr:histidinol dehydrogenase [Candidatus Brockarchaeota archaeon]